MGKLKMAEEMAEARLPWTGYACIFISMGMTLGISLYGYIKGFYYSFIGPLVIALYILILVRRRLQWRRIQGGTRIVGARIEVHDSETDELRRITSLNRLRSTEDGQIDAQQSLVRRYEEEAAQVPEATWIWRRPPSYCDKGMS